MAPTADRGLSIDSATSSPVAAVVEPYGPAQEFPMERVPILPLLDTTQGNVGCEKSFTFLFLLCSNHRI